MTIEQLLLIVVVIGIFGSTLEKVGVTVKSPRLENIGKAITAVTSDVPRFVTKVIEAVKPSAKPPVVQ